MAAPVLARGGRRAVIAALAFGLVGLVVGTVGCGVEAVDPAQEAAALAATCRSWAQRIADDADIEVDTDEFEAYLRSEPGGPERSPAGTTKEFCMAALREARSDDAADGTGS